MYLEKDDKIKRDVIAATKIGCTIGPSSQDLNILKELLHSGMRVSSLYYT